MNMHTRKLTLAVVAMTTLAACGGGPSVPEVPNDTPGTDITLPAPRDAHYSNTIGVGFDETKAVTSIAMASANGFGQRTGSISIVPKDDRDYGFWYNTDTAEMAVDHESGPSDRAEAYIFVPIGEDFIEEGFTVVGEATLGDDRQMLIAEHEISGRRLYIPSDGSPVRVGAVSSSFDDEDMVAHGVFGIESGISDIASQAGTGKFTGISEASVVGGSFAGNFRGTSRGTLDFDSGYFTVDARMSSDAGNIVSVGSAGMMTDDGFLQGSLTTTGLSGDDSGVEGIFQGHLFGANAEDIGGTFSGGTGSTNIAGQMLMSR